MSIMPTDRTSDWRRIFDRFGSLDGALRHKPASEKAKPDSETESGSPQGRPSGSVPPPMPQGRRVRK